MENSRQHVRYLTISEILMVTDWHASDYQILKENQLHYLADAVSAKFGDIELFPTLFQKLLYRHIISLQDMYF